MDDDLSPAEYIARTSFECWTTEIKNIISHTYKREFIYENVREIHNDFPLIRSLIWANHELSPPFRELITQYLAALDWLLAQHNEHLELFNLKDLDLLTKNELTKHGLTFEQYYLNHSERYFINQVKSDIHHCLASCEHILA